MISFSDLVNNVIAQVQKGSHAGVVKEWQTRRRSFDTPESSNVAFIGEDGKNLHVGYKSKTGAPTVYVHHGAAGLYDRLYQLYKEGASMGHETKNLRNKFPVYKIEGDALVPTNQPYLAKSDAE